MSDLLLIDDDPEVAELLSSYLQSEGFALDSMYTGESGIQAAEKKSYELILLDVMLPDLSGFNVLSALRSSSNIPVIMLTGRGEEIDRVVGLEMGADDYIAKPFPLRELLARIRAVLRRYDTSRSEGGAVKMLRKKSIEFGNVVIDRNTRNMTLDDNPVHLTSTEYDIVEQLALNMGAVVERNDLMEQALGRGVEFDDYVLNVHMSNLRKKLGSHVSIKTIRGRGYLLATSQGAAV
ncbi:DNA-binding response regulator [Pseudodesulfovibrio nedwellii]|uniref:DNA-binding response regulator n=1 Tax=Pseudodesulfovibrio nedwellii TaxID=2973072 RepID=A0ABM8AZS3_9BACT|nr:MULTISPECIES: response regulator transcription factor [Pseudodesulfovibrio]BDQ36980.1 DNA-binding response regulator [Pseudodesulfovibrio nedwellii]